MQRALTYNEISEMFNLAEREGRISIFNLAEREGRISIEETVKQGDLEGVKKYVSHGHGGINSSFGAFRHTLLHCASSSGQKHIVEYLLSCPGINISAEDRGGITSLHYAALNSHPEIVKLLCEFDHNKGINTKTQYGSTPLHLAIDSAKNQDEISRSNAVVDYLIQVPGISLLALTCESETPLTLAKKYNRTDLMEKIVRAVTVQSKLSLKAIHPDDSSIMISFDNEEGMDNQFWLEVAVPNLIFAFDNNNESLYKVSSQIDRQGFSYISRLVRKDGSKLDIENENDFQSIAVDISIQLAKKTDIRIKDFCQTYLKSDIYCYKANRDKSAFRAYIIPILISLARQDDRLFPELWIKIFSYCNDAVREDVKISKAMNDVLQSIINNENGKSLVTFYSSAGGSALRASQLSIFSPSVSEKMKKLHEWAKENPNGASKKTLSHYFL